MLNLSLTIARLALRGMRAAAGGGGGSFSPSLVFTDARNSQYLSLTF